MFISKLLEITNNLNQSPNQEKEKITLKPFVDLFLDSSGWYAVGHHDRKRFLSAVIKKEKYPYSEYLPMQVQQSWALFEGNSNSFELVDSETQSALPITLIEDLGELCNCYD